MKVRGGIAGYFRQVGEIIARSRSISSQELYAEKRTSTEGFLRGNIFFKDGSQLHFRELITTEPSVRLVSYTYHYMNPKGEFVFRYDDSEHYPQVPNAPHHKHIGDKEVISTTIPNLETVLREIELLIKP